MTGEPVVLVNRTEIPLTFVADSRHYVLQPGDNYGFNRAHAFYAKKQNPLMGSEDYYTLDFTSLVGIKGEDDCDPISTAVLEAANKEEAERFNRERSGLRAAVKVAPRHRIPTGRTGGITTAANENAFAIGR